MLRQFFCAFRRTLKYSMTGLDQVWGKTSPLYLFKDFNYWPDIWWDDAQQHETDCYLKWLCSAIFCALNWTLKFPVKSRTKAKGRRGRSNSFNISAISLTFCGMMHSTMKQLAIKMVLFGLFLRVARNFEIFHDRLGPGRWNWGNHITTWNLVAWCCLPCSGSLFEMATLR